MTKIINAPAAYVDESLQGLCLAHPSLKIIGDEGRVVARAATKEPGKVGIASGGGFGHLPLFCGYVGPAFWTPARSAMSSRGRRSGPRSTASPGPVRGRGCSA